MRITFEQQKKNLLINKLQNLKLKPLATANKYKRLEFVEQYKKRVIRHDIR